MRAPFYKAGHLQSAKMPLLDTKKIFFFLQSHCSSGQFTALQGPSFILEGDFQDMGVIG